MPLKKGSSKKTISSNIGEMMSSFKKSGSIGTSKPRSKKAAVKQAAAIAYKEAGKPRKMKKGGEAKVQGPAMEVYRKDAFKKTKIY
jgi:hypothetical protein